MASPQKYKAMLTRWLKYTGSKYFQVKYLDEFPVPNFDVYAEPCVGSGSIAFYFMNRTCNKRFILNDRNKELIQLLQQLYQDGPDAVFNNPNWRKYQEMVRYSEDNKGQPHRKAKAPKFEAGQYLKELNYCYQLMRKHTITFSSIDVIEFMDKLPNDAFVVLDPPYISLILKYRYEQFGVSKLIECIERLKQFKYWVLYNDEVAPHLALLQDIKCIHYIVKRGGQRSRVEYVFLNF
jgi:site-specific DNA-adenine methylase